jgi:hypothetical protein
MDIQQRERVVRRKKTVLFQFIRGQADLFDQIVGEGTAIEDKMNALALLILRRSIVNA